MMNEITTIFGSNAARALTPLQFAKFQYRRLPKLLEACRDLPCQHCGCQDGTVVASHSNWAIHGKGRGIKASDIYVASLCGVCHHELDQGASLGEVERQRMWYHAHVSTIRKLHDLHRLPENMPVPELSFSSRPIEEIPCLPVKSSSPFCA